MRHHIRVLAWTYSCSGFLEDQRRVGWVREGRLEGVREIGELMSLVDVLGESVLAQ